MHGVGQIKNQPCNRQSELVQEPSGSFLEHLAGQSCEYSATTQDSDTCNLRRRGIRSLSAVPATTTTPLDLIEYGGGLLNLMSTTGFTAQPGSSASPRVLRPKYMTTADGLAPFDEAQGVPSLRRGAPVGARPRPPTGL